MSTIVLKKSYNEPPFCEKEILRYASCKVGDGETLRLLKSCTDEVKPLLCYKACAALLPVKAENGVCDFGIFSLSSQKLAQNLNGCRNAVIFAATVGVGIDRLIAKYGRISPARALMLQAIGTERIEALCDTLCADIAAEHGFEAAPRFSPGYGDLSLGCQREFFALLAPEKHIGLTLNDSLLMSPTKSVTAVMGLGSKQLKNTTNKCALCDKRDCTFRGAL